MEGVNETKTPPQAEGGAPILRDEFIIDVNKVRLIADNQDRIQSLFQVTFTYGDDVNDPAFGHKQWVEVEGTDEDRKLAKDYVKALCNPIARECIKYPIELEKVLKNDLLRDRIEKQSRTVLCYENPGEIIIQGNEALSVTLALSALEDVISEYWELDEFDIEEVLGTPRPSHSDRLDTELRRRLSVDHGTEMDDLIGMNNYIKRTILDVLITNKEDEPVDSLDDLGIVQRELIPPVASGSDRTSPDFLGDASRQLQQIQIKHGSSGDNSMAKDPAAFLREFAIAQGFSNETVDAVFKKFGTKIKFADFYTALKDCDSGSDHVSSTVFDGGKDDVRIININEPENAVSKKLDEKVSKQVASYVKCLQKDHVEEEGIENIDELKIRNSKRQQILMQVFEQRKANSIADAGVDNDVTMVISDDDSDADDDVSSERAEFPKVLGNIDLTQDSSEHDDVDAPHSPLKPQTKKKKKKKKKLKNHDAQKTLVSDPNQQSSSDKLIVGQADLRTNRSPSPKRYRKSWDALPHPGEIAAEPPRKASVTLPNNLRYVVIDGSNVAMTHGNGEVFSCRGIELCIEYFLKRGHREITAFVPQWRLRQFPNNQYPIKDQHLLELLRKRSHLVFTPSRRIPGKSNIVCYDDRYVLRLAQETNGIIVSNDNYRDLYLENREWRPIIENRLLMFSFVMDIFMPPDDPLGMRGPDLSTFLRRDDLFGMYPQPLLQNSMDNLQPTQQNFNNQPPNAWRPLNVQQPNFHRPPYQQPQFLTFPNNIPRQRHHAPNQPFQPPPSPASHPLLTHPPSNSFHSPPQNDAIARELSRRRQPSRDAADGTTWQEMPRRQRTVSGKSRPEVKTKELMANLKDVFGEQADVQRILDENPEEEDLNTLSVYMLNYLS